MVGRLVVISLLAFGASSVVLAGSVSEKTGVNAALTLAPSTADFVTAAAMSDMTEIAASRIALDRGDAAENAFAQQMIADHTKSSAALKAMVSAGKVQAPLPAELDSSAQKTIDRLQNTLGASFRSEFDSMQVDAHKNAVSLFERYAKGGDNPDLKDWAQATLPTLQHHLEMAKALASRKI